MPNRTVLLGPRSSQKPQPRWRVRPVPGENRVAHRKTASKTRRMSDIRPSLGGFVDSNSMHRCTFKPRKTEVGKSEARTGRIGVTGSDGTVRHRGSLPKQRRAKPPLHRDGRVAHDRGPRPARNRRPCANRPYACARHPLANLTRTQG